LPVVLFFAVEEQRSIQGEGKGAFERSFWSPDLLFVYAFAHCLSLSLSPSKFQCGSLQQRARSLKHTHSLSPSSSISPSLSPSPYHWPYTCCTTQSTPP
jgi:hypothetical protein